MDDGSRHDREVRAARNQALFRSVNEKLRDLNDAFADVSETYAIACECANTTCVETVEIPMQDYLEVRAHPNRFVVLTAHIIPDVESVVAGTDGYVIVEKNVDVQAAVQSEERQA